MDTESTIKTETKTETHIDSAAGEADATGPFAERVTTAIREHFDAALSQTRGLVASWESIGGAIRYARSMSAWWRGDQSSCPPVTASELQVAKDAHRAVTGNGWGGREPTMAEIAASWDRAADLLEKGGTP